MRIFLLIHYGGFKYLRFQEHLAGIGRAVWDEKLIALAHVAIVSGTVCFVLTVTSPWGEGLTVSQNTVLALIYLFFGGTEKL